MREAENAIKRSFFFNGFFKKLVGFIERVVVIVNRPRPLVEAEIGCVVEALDAWTWG